MAVGPGPGSGRAGFSALARQAGQEAAYPGVAGTFDLAIGYIRVSTDDQSLRPEAQRQAIEKWCLASGADLVAVREDGGQTEDQEREATETLANALSR